MSCKFTQSLLYKRWLSISSSSFAEKIWELKCKFIKMGLWVPWVPGSFRSPTTPRSYVSMWSTSWITTCLMIVVIFTFCFTIIHSLTILIWGVLLHLHGASTTNNNVIIIIITLGTGGTLMLQGCHISPCTMSANSYHREIGMSKISNEYQGLLSCVQ